MRFNWRSRVMATALAAISFLQLTGCSSQQQEQEEVVQGQQGEEGQEGQEVSGQQEEAEGQNVTEGGNEASAQDNSGQMAENGENLASTQGENSAPASEEQLQEVMNEMTSNGGAANGSNVMEGVPTDEMAATNGQEEAPAPIQEVAPETNATTEVAAEAAPVTETPGEAPPAAPAAESVAVAQAPGLPEANSKMPYVVQAGDTLGKIATRIYGDQKRWRDISDLTGLSNPNSIYPGDVVYYTLDEAAVQFAAKEASMIRGMEVVQQGDTLAAISKRVYGSSKHWRHIWRQNDSIDNPDQLSAGMNVYYVQKDSMQSVFNLDSKLESSNVAQVAKTTTKTFAKHNKNNHKSIVSNLR